MSEGVDAFFSLIYRGTHTTTMVRVCHIKSHKEVELKFQDSHINLAPTVKCLRVLFEEHMSWDPHVEATATKLARVTGILCKVRYSLPRNVKLLIYNSLLMSVLSYCYLVWGTTTASNMSKLHIIQKKPFEQLRMLRTKVIQNHFSVSCIWFHFQTCMNVSSLNAMNQS